MKIGQAHIDFEALQITGSAGSFSVEPKVMEVLTVLIANAGQVVTRDDLIDKVWGVGYGGDERLSRAISLLRKALGDTRGKHDYIQTIPKRGYRLTVEIEGPLPVDEHNDIDVSAEPTLRTPPVKKKPRTGLLAAITAAVLALIALVVVGKDSPLLAPQEPPLVMIMDSAHPSRIYDDQVKSDGGTNADILSDILADLPIRTQKELISPSWHRYEAMTQFDPDLIVIHYSGFKQEDASGDRPQLKLLIEYFGKTDTEFLVYSRARQDWLQENMDSLLKDVYAENPDIRNRVDIFPLLAYGEPHWMDQSAAQGIKLRVKETLGLE